MTGGALEVEKMSSEVGVYELEKMNSKVYRTLAVYQQIFFLALFLCGKFDISYSVYVIVSVIPGLSVLRDASLQYT